MFAKTPTKGMRDFLPQEFLLRQELLSVIQKTYEKYGFFRIETPAVESLDLLCSKQGGDNEKLIYKILKRGEKLENAEDGQLCDLGLRYDLTVPLCRYYANNCGQLPAVFKSIQMDNVWRADRPQRGRFRQFVQCDIDIIGESTFLAETELISATSEALSNVGFDDITVRVNDRRLLSALADKCGFGEDIRENVFIILDKLDKIGVNGVLEEIEALAPGKSVDFVNLLNRVTGADNPLEKCIAELGDCLDPAVADNLRQILYVSARTVKNGKAVFDVTLVRGMNYYTGTVFEVSLSDLPVSVAGGGRYDKMIGKITGTDVPACGFSIGFERIAMLYAEKKQKERQSGSAVIVPKDIDAKQLTEVYDTLRHMRKTGNVTLLKKIKNFSYQIKQLRENGYTVIYEYREGALVKINE